MMLGRVVSTRVICSTFIAQLVKSEDYPFLPQVVRRAKDDRNTCHDEVLKIRHHTLYAPRDFDVSPYFAVVKPTLERGFDFHALSWDRPVAAPDVPQERTLLSTH